MKKQELVYWNNDDPLAISDGETRTANAALRDYYSLGPGRTTLILSERYQEMNKRGDNQVPPSVSYGTVRNWCHQWQWIRRVQRQEDIDISESRAIWEGAASERTKVWEDRRADIVESTYQSAKLLRDAAVSMLEYVEKWEIGESIEEKKNDLGGIDRIITKTIRPKVTLSQLASALAASDQMLRTVAGMSQASLPDRRDDPPPTQPKQELNVLVVNVGE